MRTELQQDHHSQARSRLALWIDIRQVRTVFFAACRSGPGYLLHVRDGHNRQETSSKQSIHFDLRFEVGQCLLTLHGRIQLQPMIAAQLTIDNDIFKPKATV